MTQAERSWVVGQEHEFPECPVTARCGEVEVGLEKDNLSVYTEAGYDGYGGCNHNVYVYIPIDVLVKLLGAHGYSVERK
jgi:hypothetical protein